MMSICSTSTTNALAEDCIGTVSTLPSPSSSASSSASSASAAAAAAAGEKKKLEPSMLMLESVQRGEHVAAVLSRAGHDAGEMMQSMQLMAQRAVNRNEVDAATAIGVLDYFSQRMNGYTYMMKH